MTEAEPPIRILLVDDQPLFRGAIASLILDQDGMQVVGEAADGIDALEQAHRLMPDIVVMDVEMPVMNGVEATRFIKEQLPSVKVVMLTVSEQDDHLFEAIRFGANGYLLKDLRPEELFDMLRRVMKNETPLSPAIGGRLIADIRNAPGPRSHDSVGPTEAPAITRRELEVLQLVAEGLSNKEIGKTLSITEGTVKNHVHNALEKLGLENRIQAAAFIVRQGLRRPKPGE
ncbi:MAG: response regulator transcription factor [Actinomycetes bacterium]